VTPEKQSLPLIERIYESVLDQPLWAAFARDLAAAYGDVAVGFALQVPGQPETTGGVYAAGFDLANAKLREAFVSHTRRGLPWEEARRHQFLGRFGLASEVISDDEVEKTEFYRDWMEPQQLAPVAPMGHTIALEGERPVATLAIYRKRGGKPFREADLTLGNLLVPHLARAYRLHARVRENAALAEALDRLPTGVILLDARSQPVVANRAAHHILALEDGIGIDESGPHAASAADDAVLKQLIQGAVETSTTSKVPEGSVMAVSRPSGLRAFPLMAAPLLSAGDDTALYDAVAVLFISDLDAHTLPRSEVLRALYALTHAEVELVELLCDGFSLEEAADRRGVTMNTARSQLKQVFVKTRTSRQSELVRLVLAGIAPIRNP
jgi:DNA-binding CsgD family transcriptional regulator/PAS domain-containing protein